MLDKTNEVNHSNLNINLTKELVKNFMLNSETAVIYLDTNGKIQNITPTITSITGISQNDIGRFIFEMDFINNNKHVKEIIKKTINEFSNEDSKANERYSLKSQQYSPKTTQLYDTMKQLEFLQKLLQYHQHDDLYITTNDLHIYQIHIRPYTTLNQGSKGLILTLYNITKLKELESNIENEKFFTSSLYQHLKLCFYAIKPDTYELLFYNHYMEQLRPEVAIGEVCYKSLAGRNTPCDVCPLSNMNQNKHNTTEVYDDKNGTWYSISASTIEMPDGQKAHVICSSDVTGFMERVHSKDKLTGLFSLSKFEAEAIKLTRSLKSNYAICYSDFDKFKNINDEWGYSVGNELLVLYAEKMKENLNDNELICRVTADKFITLFSYDEKDLLFDRVKRISSNISHAIKDQYPRINMVITSGIYFQNEQDLYLSVSIDKANIARKTIKGSHKSSFAVYDETLHRQISKEKMIEHLMYDALSNNEFLIYMQPKIDLMSSEIIGAEALVRWKLSNGQMLSPMEFIPVFEKNGFIDELDFYVYEKTFIAFNQWIASGKKPIIISLNVSRAHLNDSKFFERLEQLVDKYQIPAHQIELELTESIFFKELDRLVYVMNNLRKKGFLISIDDFGSGYSSLNLLKTLPIDILKLDREFFSGNKIESNDKIVISGIITLAKGLGLKVVSEGVETSEQALFLKDNLCDMAQGYLFYKPLPMDEFEKLIS